MVEATESKTASAPKTLLKEYLVVRQASEKLAEPLEPEDCVVQSMSDVSPTKWHLGHMTWFFEQVILAGFDSDYKLFHEKYFFIYNSYYESFGKRWVRDERGTLSRPTVKETLSYRQAIDQRMSDLITRLAEDKWSQLAGLIKLGLDHERQHQELILTDIKHVLGGNPLGPVYRQTLPERQDAPVASASPLEFVEFEGGLVEIGASGDSFSYDNERPRHKVYLQEFLLANRLVTCGEFLEFIADDGYQSHLLWLSDGWRIVNERNWDSPLYWRQKDGRWMIYTLSGWRELDPAEPVCHVSYYEAAAYARWRGMRLPTEFEWETAAIRSGSDISAANDLETDRLHPSAASSKSGGELSQIFGDVWEWTASAHLAYPGYVPVPGALGEYNGKFMSDQMILRGGSCFTPGAQLRATYRNFFQCDKRWQMTGLRLADNSE